jgi:hypothetical protein
MKRMMISPSGPAAQTFPGPGDPAHFGLLPG